MKVSFDVFCPRSYFNKTYQEADLPNDEVTTGVGPSLI